MHATNTLNNANCSNCEDEEPPPSSEPCGPAILVHGIRQNCDCGVWDNAFVEMNGDEVMYTECQEADRASAFADGAHWAMEWLRSLVEMAMIIRFYHTTETPLARIDPLQAALDNTVANFPDPVRSAVLRTTYAWGTNPEGEPILLVWLVLHDNASIGGQNISGNIELMRPVAHSLATLQIEAPFFLRVRTASEAA